MPSEPFQIDEKERVFEKIKTTHLIFPSALITFILFLISFYPYYFSSIKIIPLLTPYLSYVTSYLFLLLLIYVIAVVTYKTKAIQMDIFSPYVLVFGFHPMEYNSRLGVKLIDYIGLILSIVFCFISLLLFDIRFLFPGFLILAILFLSSILWGSVKEWEFKRRTQK